MRSTFQFKKTLKIPTDKYITRLIINLLLGCSVVCSLHEAPVCRCAQSWMPRYYIAIKLNKFTAMKQNREQTLSSMVLHSHD